MLVWFISDMHFDHESIIKYTKRKYKNVHEMNEAFVKKWNSLVKEDDLVYHVGDFSFGGNKNALMWEKRLNGRIVHIQGNHDKNNGVKTYLVKGIMHFGNKSIYVIHRPPHTVGEIPYGCDFVISGHVHHLYKHKYVGDIPVINVSADVWNYAPVKATEILKYYEKIKKVKKNGKRK